MVVFDDYTQPVKVQRMVAWREVASRIAHEIKNPLTPIQLSAQRIRRRFRQRVEADPDDVKVFDECVDAITSQVDGLKLLVDEFSNFARLPTANPQAGDLNRIIADAVASYDGTERRRLRRGSRSQPADRRHRPRADPPRAHQPDRQRDRRGPARPRAAGAAGA